MTTLPAAEARIPHVRDLLHPCSQGPASPIVLAYGVFGTSTPHSMEPAPRMFSYLSYYLGAQNVRC